MALSKRHPAALFAVLAVALGTTGAAYAAVSAQTAPKVVAKTETQVEQGKQLFLEGCSSCHGLAAQGASDGPSLIGVGAASVDFQVGTGRMPLAAPGVQAMPKMPSYNEEETAALAAYIATLGAGPGIPTAEMHDTTNAELALGGELFRTNCAQCHGASAVGGALSEGRKAPSLMDADAKKKKGLITVIGCIIFITHWVDVQLLIIPSSMKEQGKIGLIEFGFFFIFLGTFLFVILRSIASRPLLVKNHPYLEESKNLYH
mgnify:CR=1 FL=1